MVIYIDVRTNTRLSVKSLNARLEELGGKAGFGNKGSTERGGYTKHIWHHKRFGGGIEIGEVPDDKLIYVSARSAYEEERLASSWIEWVIKHFHNRISKIELTLEYAKVGKE
jgi:hypothetical protein